MLVQPATVARWHREGLRGCRSRRSRRRLGRPCIDTHLRALIRRMATENRLWGAPRIHGELLKLGIVVSERTVSRYLPDRPTVPSQTWRTFLANHLVALASTSSVTSSNATGDDDVVDAGDALLRPAPSLRDGPCVISQWVGVDWLATRQRSAPRSRVVQDLLHRRRRAPSGKDPPEGWAVAAWIPRTYGRRSPFCGDFGWFQRPRNSLPSSALLTAGSPSAVVDLYLSNHVIRVVAEPTRAHGRRRTRLPVDPRDGRSIGEPQGAQVSSN